MKLPAIQGLIRRRILVNFRVDPAVVQNLLPAPFQPTIIRGCAMVGICLIRLENMRPFKLPAIFGMSSENAAHRIAVSWTDTDGKINNGVYIPRRDSSSLLNCLVGGRFFPGELHHAIFDVVDNGEVIHFESCARDYSMQVKLRVRRADALPTDSVFTSLDEASNFFRNAPLGYSETSAGKHLEAVVLHTDQWEVEPYDADFIESSYFSNESLFPKNSIEFDSVLVMRNIEHTWCPASDLAKRPCPACV